METIYSNIGSRQQTPPDGDYEGKQSGYALSFKVDINNRPVLFHMTTDVGVRNLDWPVRVTIKDGSIAAWSASLKNGCTATHEGAIS